MDMSLIAKSTMLTAVIAIFAIAACSQDKPTNSNTTAVPKPKLPPAAEKVSADTAKTAAPKSASPKIAVEGEGLRLFNPITTAARSIPFGRPRAELLAILERLRGPAQKATNADCGAGPVEFATWPDGLSVVFQGNRFVGWGLDRRADGKHSTASGIGPGSTREDLDGAYANVSVRRTSLGTEFSAGGFSGLIDGPSAYSRITDMWAGISCVAR